MINSIPKIESDKKYPFGRFSEMKNDRAFWLQNSTNTIQNVLEKSNTDTVNIAAVNNNLVESSDPKNDTNLSAFSLPIKIITPEEAQKTNNVKLIGFSIAGATLLTAATLFFVLKGGTQGLSKNFKKMRSFFETQIQKAKLNNNGRVSLSNKFYIYMVKILDDFLTKKEVVNNFTTFKDTLFKRMMGLNKYTGKLHDGISRLFEKIGRQAVVNCYSDTAGKFKETNLLLKSLVNEVMEGSTSDVIIFNGVKRTKAQWLSLLDKMNVDLEKAYNQHFDSSALTTRYLHLKKAADTLKATFAKMKVFLSPDVYKGFLAESTIAKEKATIKNVVHSHRLELSYSISDMARDADSIILGITSKVSYKDVDTIKSLRIIRNCIKRYAKNPIANRSLKTEIPKDIDNLMKEISEAIASNKINEKVAKELLSECAQLKNTFVDFKQGKIEDILDIYKVLLPEDKYKQVAKSYKESIKSLDKSINIETEDFSNKLRDLAIGSAPTDILTMLGSLGVLGYYLGKSADNDQRVSIAIKYGFPTLAGIGMSLYCNAKLFAGTKSLMIGTVSTWLLNKLGVLADDAIKKHKSNNAKQFENVV